MTQSIRDIPKSRGRPKTTGRGEAIVVRMHDPALADLDAWIAAQPDPKPSRPEAIRRLLERALDNREPPLAEQIARVEQKLARKIPAAPSPEKGVALMRHGLAEVQHRALVEKRRAGASGRKAAAELEGEAPAKQARGKKGRSVKDGSLTRRAIVGAREMAREKATVPRSEEPGPAERAPVGRKGSAPDTKRGR